MKYSNSFFKLTLRSEPKNLSRVLLVSVLLAFLQIPHAFGQYDNPGKKYLDAYKKYENATCPIKEDGIKHFVYFSRDREAIRNHPFLKVPQLVGAQIMYSWKQLEPEKGKYNFSIVQDDYDYLKAQGKKLFIQMQDKSFQYSTKPFPDYLCTEEYDGGAVCSKTDKGEPKGWVTKRWNSKVQNRFALLLEALGKQFDGKIEGINLQETAIDGTQDTDPTLTHELYVKSIMVNMLALKKAFPQSVTMQYANFMGGEWLPWEDKGYLRSIYEYGQEIGVGLAGPDLMVQRKAQLHHALAMMHEGKFTVPLGIAIQDGNYIGETGAVKDYKKNGDIVLKNRKNIVPLLHAFAKDFLKVSYMFWVNQEPYFSEDVIPCLTSN
jgi:hypothetical protein